MPFGRTLPLTYATVATGMLFLQHAFDSYISQRQLGRLHHRSPPSSLQSYLKLITGIMSSSPGSASSEVNNEQEAKKNFLASQDYARDKLRLSQFNQFLDLIEICLMYTPFIATYILGYKRPVSGLKMLWDYSSSLSFVKDRGEIAQSIAFVACVNWIGKVTSIPLSLYKPFVLEAKVCCTKLLLPSKG